MHDTNAKKNAPATPSSAPPAPQTRPEEIDPANSESLKAELKGETTEHAQPPRLEDEGQSGG